MDKAYEIEKSINKTYKKDIWKRFIAGINEYEMIKEGDSIAVCVSGGKDSMLLAKCMQMLQRHSDFPFEVKFLCMDPGYNPENRQRIMDNAALMGIPLHIFEANIFDYVSQQEKNPCYLCARMRRGYLYKNAREIGCNKIALGHHFDDVIETVLMSVLYGGELKTMMPKLHSENYEGMELIRPLYMVRERDIIRWMNYNGLSFLQCACRFTEKAETAEYEALSKRKEVKALIESLRKENGNVEMSIFRSVQNVNLGTVIGYRKGDVTYSFLDCYDEKQSCIFPEK